jgi:hypothetical protein
MSLRAILTLAVVTVLSVCGAAWTVIENSAGPARSTSAGRLLFPQLAEHPDNAARIRLVAQGAAFVVERKGQDWVLPEKAGFPVRPDLANSLETTLASLRAYEPKTSNPDLYRHIGVEDVAAPDARSKLVVVETRQGAELARALIGGPSASIGATPSGGTFIRRPDEKQAWLAEGSVAAPSSLSEWLETVIHVPGPEVRRITILEGEKVSFEAAKPEPQGTNYALVTVDNRYGPPESVANDAAVKRIAQGIVSTRFEDVRPAETVVFGPDSRRVRFDLASGLRLEVQIGQVDDKPWVRYATWASGLGEAAAHAQQIASKTRGWAYRLADNKIAPLTVDIRSLLKSPDEAAAAASPSPLMNRLPPSPGPLPLPLQ